MDDFSITLIGADDLNQKIQDVQTKIQSSDADSIISKAAMLVLRQAMLNASGRPGPNVITGRLRASLTADIVSPTEATVGTNVEYAPFVEFGHTYTSLGGIGSRGGRMVNPFTMGEKTRVTRAYPFLYPAAEEVVSQLEGVFVSYGTELENGWGK